MKATSGAHFIALDHVRAVAAFMVVAWHFIHGFDGRPIPFGYVPLAIPFALLNEGHTGVALFMTLSGYLFAKLLDGKRIDFGAFLWNRCLRLFPLLVCVFVIVGATQPQHDFPAYAKQLIKGIALPVWPNGGWSITSELHYYLILPVFLWMLRVSRWLPLSLIVFGLLVRGTLLLLGYEVQLPAYWTIVGRIDQFALGMLAFQFRASVSGRHGTVAVALLTLAAFYTWFASVGGFWRPEYPSKAEVWAVLPTLEGLVYGATIAWYDSSFAWSGPNGRISSAIAKLGEYSYSIYLLHFFFVFRAANFVHDRIMNISNFYLALLWAAVFMAMMLPIGYLSFRFVEAPFLRYRRRYVREYPAR